MSTKIENKMTTLDIANSKKMITVQTCHGKTFVVEEAVNVQSQTIRHMIEDGCADNVIPLTNVDGKTMEKVIEYCSKHATDEEDKDSLEKWDAEYIPVDQNELYHLMMATNYLDIKELTELACQSMADRIEGKQPEEIRKEFNIKNDMPPGLEGKIRMDNQWAF